MEDEDTFLLTFSTALFLCACFWLCPCQSSVCTRELLWCGFLSKTLKWGEHRKVHCEYDLESTWFQEWAGAFIVWCYNSIPTNIHTLSHCCLSTEWKRPAQRAPHLFPHSKNRMRVHIWRYSVIRECVQTYTFPCSHKVHMVLISQLRPTA